MSLIKSGRRQVIVNGAEGIMETEKGLGLVANVHGQVRVLVQVSGGEGVQLVLLLGIWVRIKYGVVSVIDKLFSEPTVWLCGCTDSLRSVVLEFRQSHAGLGFCEGESATRRRLLGHRVRLFVDHFEDLLGEVRAYSRREQLVGVEHTPLQVLRLELLFDPLCDQTRSYAW